MAGANSLISSLTVLSMQSHTQKLTYSISASGSPVLHPLDIKSTPDEFYAITTSLGTDVVQPEISFDTTDWDVIFDVRVENGGTVGTHTIVVFLKWYNQAVGGIR